MRDSIFHVDKTYDAILTVLLMLFEPDYILSHSVSGQSGNSHLEAKEKYDARLYGIFVSVIRSKFRKLRDQTFPLKLLP